MRTLLIPVVLALAAPPAEARSTPAEVLARLHKVVEYREVTISPDSKRVAWVEKMVTPDGPASDRSVIQVAEVGQAPRRVTAREGEPRDELELAFSPDGGRLAFLSDAEKKGQLQLYVAELASGKVAQLTHVAGYLERPTFSPDGKTVAVLFLEGDASAGGPVWPSAPRTGVVAEKIPEQRLSLVPADGSGALRPISPPELFVYEYAWRPDGQAFAAIAAPGSGDDNWWFAKLHTFDVASGAARLVHTPALQICEPTFSPDGTRIAFIEGLMSDAGANGGDVFVVPAAGGKATNVTPGLRGSASSLEWLRGEEIDFGMQVEGDSAFAQVPATGGKVTVRWRAPVNVARRRVIEAAFSADGQVTAVIASAFDRPPEVLVGPLGFWKPITARNKDLASPAGAATSITWKSDRYDVQGWLLAPPEPPVGKAPMVVIVHGGPAGAVRNAWGETPSSSPARAITSSCPTRAARSARARRSPAPT